MGAHCLVCPPAWPPPAWPLQRPGHHRLDNFLWLVHCLASTLASAATRPPAPGQLPLGWPSPAWPTAWSVHWPGHHLPGLRSDQATTAWSTSARLVHWLASAATSPPAPGQLPLGWPPPAWPLQRPGHLRLANFRSPGLLPGLSTGQATTCLVSAATRPPAPGQLPLPWPPPAWPTAWPLQRPGPPAPGQLPLGWPPPAWSVHRAGHHLPGLCSDQGHRRLD